MATNITYRKQGPVAPPATQTKGAPLTAAEIDGNFKSIQDGLSTLEQTVTTASNSLDEATTVFNQTTTSLVSTIVQHVSNTDNPHNLTKAKLGLGNVDNTSDELKNSISATLTNKTISLSNNTVTGTLAQFNSAVSDANFAQLTGAETLSNKTLTAPIISGVGITFSDTGPRITGNFDGDTASNRLLFQNNSNAHGPHVGVAPYGWGDSSYIELYNASDVSNASVFQISTAGDTAHYMSCEKTGVGAYLPLVIKTGGQKRARFDTAGNFVVGADVANASGAVTLSQGGAVHATTESGVANVTMIGGIGGVSNGFTITQNTSNQLSYAWAHGNGVAMSLSSTSSTRSGTLNLGGSAHDWANPRFEVGLSAFGCSPQQYTELLHNAQEPTSGAYVFLKLYGTGASRYQQRYGDHVWDSAGGGEFPGDPITWDKQMTLTAAGNLTMHMATFGYGAGAGGSVTQSLSKTTAVTVNKPSGLITMNNASLAAGTSVEFALNNSTLTAVDQVLVRPNGFTGYAVEVSYFNSATEVVLRVTNKGATRGDALGILFAVIKGSTS